MKREHFRSRIGFIFAAAGSAIGLGNIWRFPTEVGRGGGGAFVLLYLVIILIIGIPVMICELAIGRKGQKNIVGSYRAIKDRPLWHAVGIMGIISAFIMLSYYIVIAGWGMSYIPRYFSGAIYSGITVEQISDIYTGLVESPLRPIIWSFIFISLTAFIVIRGIGKGIEKYSKYLMPILFFLLILLAFRSVTLEGAREGIEWYLRPDFRAININTVLNVLGQVFFSLSLGMGAILTYGSYLYKDSNLPKNAFLISMADLSIALISGFIIIPAVFAFNLEPGTGPALIFITLPSVFGVLPFGNVFGGIFFILLTIASITSSISILEVVVSYLIDERKINRKKAALFASLAIFIVSIPISLSQGRLRDVTLIGYNLLDLADNLTARIFLPLSGLMAVIFTGWIWKGKNALIHIRENNVKFVLGKAWMNVIKYVLPPVLVYILISGFV